MGRRAERLAEEIREQVARMIASDLKDPRLGFITVTRVELAHDLGHARVHVGVLGSEAERQKSLAALQQASGFVRTRQLRPSAATSGRPAAIRSTSAHVAMGRIYRLYQGSTPSADPPASDRSPHSWPAK